MKTSSTKTKRITLVILSLSIVSGWILSNSKQESTPSENLQQGSADVEMDNEISNSESTKRSNDKQDTTINNELKKEGCFRLQFRHLAQNQNREIEEFTNDLNVFSVNESSLNPKSVCVKINQKPVRHEIKKRSEKTEIWIGSVVGPDSEIEIAYCTGKIKCKQSCQIKSENKIDELINEEELAELADTDLENQVKELRKIASMNESLLDASVIRNWNQTQNTEWTCKTN